MARMGAACVASAGANPFTGTAVSMTVYPIVPDFERYPEYGRDEAHALHGVPAHVPALAARALRLHQPEDAADHPPEPHRALSVPPALSALAPGPSRWSFQTYPKL
jgi:hypothetical protein